MQRGQMPGPVLSKILQIFFFQSQTGARLDYFNLTSIKYLVVNKNFRKCKVLKDLDLEVYTFLFFGYLC